MELESPNGEPIKVEVVNFDSFEDQIRKKLVLAMVGAFGAIVIERGAGVLLNKLEVWKAKKNTEKPND